MKLYYISRRYDKKNDAGPKAKLDVEDILNQHGFCPIEYDFYTSKMHRLLCGYFEWNKAFKDKNGACVVLQYPLYSKISTQRD